MSETQAEMIARLESELADYRALLAVLAQLGSLEELVYIGTFRDCFAVQIMADQYPSVELCYATHATLLAACKNAWAQYEIYDRERK